MCGIVCTIQDITSSLYDLKPPCFSHHTYYIWYHVHCICVITSTVLMISHQMYFWDHILYNSRQHIHCIRNDSLWICVITPTRSMTSHPFYAWHHTHCIFVITTSPLISHPLLYDIKPTIYVTSYRLYITSHPLLMSSHYFTYDISTSVYETTSSL